MRAAEGMHVEWVDNEAVVLDPSSGELHYLNGSAALVFALVDELGFEGAMEELARRYADVPSFKPELQDVLADMKAKGLIIDD